jgi:hypothetical protein
MRKSLPMTRTKTRICSALIALLLLSACAANYIPQPGDGIVVDKATAAVRSEGSLFTVSMRPWYRTPESLNDYYSSFYITLKNTGAVPLRIDPRDIVLVDETDRQYDVVSIDMVEDLLLGDDPNPLLLTPEQQDELNRKRADARKNLWQDSFAFGDVVPNAMKSGFVFFNRIPWDNQRCRILYRGLPIEFSRQKK